MRLTAGDASMVGGVRFHIVGTETDSGRIDWNDGSYTVVGSVDHFSYDTGKGVEVYTNAHQDSGNTYSADGVFLFRITFHTTERYTIAGGVLRVEWERGHFHFFEDCSRRVRALHSPALPAPASPRAGFFKPILWSAAIIATIAVRLYRKAV